MRFLDVFLCSSVVVCSAQSAVMDGTCFSGVCFMLGSFQMKMRRERAGENEGKGTEAGRSRKSGKKPTLESLACPVYVRNWVLVEMGNC